MSGWFASRLGRKRFYLLSVALFTGSSFLCGIAPNLSALILFRVLQGVGGGGLDPTEQAILADTFEPSKRGMAFAVYGMAVVLAPAIGPTLGGYITDHFTWRWVFFINVPVGIVSLLLASRIVVDPPWIKNSSAKNQRIDYQGLSLIAVGLGALEYVLDRGQEAEWFASSTITAFAAISGAALVAFVLWEYRQPNPVVDVRLFKNFGFVASNLMMLVLGVVLYGFTVLLPQYAQLLLGYSAEQAGEVLSPGGVVVILLLPLVGRLVSRVDARWLIAFGFAAMSAARFHMAFRLNPAVDYPTAALLRIYQMLGLAFLFVPINTLAYQGVPQNRNGSVSGILNLSRNMGGDIGIALVTTLLARRSQLHQARLVEHLYPENPAFIHRISQLATALGRTGGSHAEALLRALFAAGRQLSQQAQTLAYLDVIIVLACFTAGMVPLVFLARPVRPGEAALGH